VFEAGFERRRVGSALGRQRRSRHAYGRRVKTRPLYVDRLLKSIDELTDQIQQADQELAALADAEQTCRRLMTVPGVGEHAAMWVAAELRRTAYGEVA
jgi:transposase